MSHLVTTRPKAETCPRCGRLRLTGIEEGLPYRADPLPLTLAAEVAALQAGARSYALWAGGLAYRTAGRIRLDASRGRPPVFADHRCTVPLGPADVEVRHLAAARRLLATATAQAETEPATDPAATDALFEVAEVLGARVIEPAPF